MPGLGAVEHSPNPKNIGMAGREQTPLRESDAQLEHLLVSAASSPADGSTRAGASSVGVLPSPIGASRQLEWHALLDVETHAETGSPCLFARNVREDVSKQQLRILLQNIFQSESQKLPEESRVKKFGNPVYLVNCATIDVTWKIKTKGLPHSYSDASARCMDRRPKALDRLLERSFASRVAAMEAARQKVDDAFPSDQEDTDLEVSQEGPGDEMASALLEMYVRLAKHAEQKSAVLVVPWWTHHQTNLGAQLFLQALDITCFRGPLINVSVESWTKAHEEERERFNFRVAGDTQVVEERASAPVMRRASHSVLVTASRGGNENTATNFRVAAEVAKLIAGGQTENRKYPVIAFMVNGGRNIIYSAAASSLIGIPLLVVQGSGMLCDYLPDAWLRRTDNNFDQAKECREVCRKCGFRDELTSEEGMLVRQVLQGRLLVCPITSGPSVVERVLEREYDQQEEAFVNARTRHAVYSNASSVANKPGIVLQVLIFTCLVLTALLVQTQAQLVLDGGGGNRRLHFTIASLPVLMTLFIALRRDYNFSEKSVAFNYASALIEGHLWRYSSWTGVYSNATLAKARTSTTKKKRCFVTIIRGDNLRSADIGGKSDPYVMCRILGKDGTEDKTGFKNRTLNPVWNEELLINRFDFGDTLEFEVMDHDYMSAGDFLGYARIEGGKLTASATYPVSETLELHDNGQHGAAGKEVKGNLRVKVMVSDGDEDIPNSRAQKLATETLMISQAVDVSAWAHFSSSQFNSPNLPPQTLEGGDEYLRLRLQPNLSLWRWHAKHLHRRQVVLKFGTYALGAVGTILALLWHEAWVVLTTCLVAAVAAWDSMCPVDEQLRRANNCVRRLAEAETEWLAVPKEKRSMQQLVELLVGTVEDALLQVVSQPDTTLEAVYRPVHWD